jgi:hypothetical protein
MAISRYVNTPILAIGFQRGTSSAVSAIRAAIRAKTLQYKVSTLKGSERLDTIAGDVYGDGRYWWVIAAASDIGWMLQCPAGTHLKIPDLTSALDIATKAS